MTNFEIAMLLALIGYGIIFGIICAGLFSRTRRNKSGIEITNRILDCHNLRIDGIIDRIEDSKNKKEGVEVGKWKKFSDETCYWYGCSVCGNKAPKSQYGIDYFSPYCPACGTRMGLESEVRE